MNETFFLCVPFLIKFTVANLEWLKSQSIAVFFNILQQQFVFFLIYFFTIGQQYGNKYDEFFYCVVNYQQVTRKIIMCK